MSFLLYFFAAIAYCRPSRVIDTHVHFVNQSCISYRPQVHWNQTVLPDEFVQDSSQSSIIDEDDIRAVFIEVAALPKDNVKEVQWVSELASRTKRPKISAIVGYAALETGKAVEASVQQLKSSTPLLRGIRRLLYPEFGTSNSPCWFMTDDFVAGLYVLRDYDLHFELLPKYYTQYDCVIELVKRAPPDLRIMLEHVGGADMTNPSEFHTWRDFVTELSRFKNVFAKLSGVPERADVNFDDWSIQQVWPYIKTVVNAFGYDRVVYGGNWFVVKQFSTYKRWSESLFDMLQTSGASQEELDATFFRNAERFYRLN